MDSAKALLDFANESSDYSDSFPPLKSGLGDVSELKQLAPWLRNLTTVADGVDLEEKQREETLKANATSLPVPRSNPVFSSPEEILKRSQATLEKEKRPQGSVTRRTIIGR